MNLYQNNISEFVERWRTYLESVCDQKHIAAMSQQLNEVSFYIQRITENLSLDFLSEDMRGFIKIILGTRRLHDVSNVFGGSDRRTDKKVDEVFARKKIPREIFEESF